MRLLLVSPAVARGGAEEYVVMIARGARRRGHDVVVAFSTAPGVDGIAAELDADGCAVRRESLPEGTGAPSLTQRIAAVSAMLREVRPDAVHLTLPWPDQGLPVMLACAADRVPLVTVFQNVETPLVLPWRWPLYWWCRMRRQRWVAVSGANRQPLARTFALPPSCFTVVHNGADPVHADGSALRAELGIAADAPIILTVGRLDRQKAHDRTLGAAAAVLRAHPGARFVWAGDGPDRDALIEDVKRRGLTGTVLFLGRRTDVPRLLHAATVFLFPSRFEGLPFALVEAMLAGLPVVTTAAGGIPELVHDGVDGLIVDGDDATALAAAVSGLLADPTRRRELGAAARLRAAAFGTDRMVDDTLAVLSSLIPKATP